MESYARIEGKVGFMEHVCTDQTCSCQQDETIKKFRGKWLVELNMLEPKTRRPIRKPILIGPFETEAEANEGLKAAAKDAQEILKEKGYGLEERKPFNPMRAQRK